MSGDFGCLCTSGRMEISLGEVQRSIFGGVLGISISGGFLLIRTYRFRAMRFPQIYGRLDWRLKFHGKGGMSGGLIVDMGSL